MPLTLGALFFFVLATQAQQKPKEIYLYYPDGKISSHGFIDAKKKPTGIWETYYQTGVLKSRGIRQGDVPDGKWEFFNNKGLPTLKVYYQDGKKHGWETGYQNGLISLKVPYQKGLREGAAYRYHRNGKKSSQTNYRNDKKIGRAFSYDTTGALVQQIRHYENNVLLRSISVNRVDHKAQKKGLWVWFHQNQNIRLEGTFLDGKRHGYFRYYDQEGNFLRVEYYLKGVLQPLSETAEMEVQRTFYSDRKLKTYKTFRREVAEGMHKFYDRNGRVIQATLYRFGVKKAEGEGLDSLGAKVSLWKYYYDGKNISSQGKYLHGQRTGKWVYYYANGMKMAQGNYIQGKKEGFWQYFSPLEKKMIDISYKLGQKEGDYQEYSETQKVISGNYLNNKKHNRWVSTIGDIKEQRFFKEGKAHGKHIIYNRRNEKLFEGFFREGVPEGKHTFYKNESVVLERDYQQGYQEGLEIYYNDKELPILESRYSSGDILSIGGNIFPK